MKLLDLTRSLFPWSKSGPLAARGGSGRELLTGNPSDGASIGVVEVNYYKARLARQSRRMRYMFIGSVVLPTLLAAIYYGFFASDRYVSQAQLVVTGDSDSEGPGNSSNPLMALIQPGTVSVTGTIVLYNYIQSMDMMDRLDKKVGLRSRFSTTKADWFSRLSPDASNEDFMDYFQKRVTVIGEPNNPVLAVNVEAFTPEDAQAIMRGIVSISEARMNDLMQQREQDTIEFAKAEVAEAHQRLLEAQAKITKYRMEHSEIDPIEAAQAVGGIANGVLQSLTDERANLTSMLTYLKPDNPAVLAIKARIRGLEQQLTQTRSNLAGSDPHTYAALVSEFETLRSEETLAQSEYADTLEFLSVARGDAQRHHTYVVDFVSPNLPEESTEPERIRAVATVFVISCLFFGIGTMIMAAVREQAGV